MWVPVHMLGNQAQVCDNLSFHEFIPRAEFLRRFTMLLVLQVVTVFLVAVAMSMAVAHALEYPGKRRLDEQTYLAVQTIYYPGFSVGGIGEVMAVVATFILMLVMRQRGDAFWLVLTAFVAVVVMHAVFWLVTQPVNKFWLQNQKMGSMGAKFFNTQSIQQTPVTRVPDWRVFRNRWEYSHIFRAALSVIALLAIVIAIAR